MKDDETEALGDVVDELGGEKEDEVVARYSNWYRKKDFLVVLWSWSARLSSLSKFNHSS